MIIFIFIYCVSFFVINVLCKIRDIYIINSKLLITANNELYKWGTCCRDLSWTPTAIYTCTPVHVAILGELGFVISFTVLPVICRRGVCARSGSDDNLTSSTARYRTLVYSVSPHTPTSVHYRTVSLSCEYYSGIIYHYVDYNQE